MVDVVIKIAWVYLRTCEYVSARLTGNKALPGAGGGGRRQRMTDDKRLIGILSMVTCGI